DAPQRHPATHAAQLVALLQCDPPNGPADDRGKSPCAAEEEEEVGHAADAQRIQRHRVGRPHRWTQLGGTTGVFGLRLLEDPGDAVPVLLTGKPARVWVPARRLIRYFTHFCSLLL